MRKTNRALALVALLLMVFMPAMEMTVVSTAMPTVIADLGGIHLYSWVFTAYILATTVTVPVAGKLADLYGRKPVMLVGIALFLAGSIWSGMARSMTHLILARAVQGFGGGAMQPISMTIAGDLFTAAERARIQGVFGAVWGIAGLAGPLVGGLIIHALSWPWVFFINLPFGVASMLVLVVSLHENVQPRQHRLDLAGAVLLGATIVLVLASGSAHRAMWALPAALLCLAGFVAVERRAKEAVLPLGLFRSRIMVVSSAAGALIGGAMISTTTFVPLFVQGVQGGTPTEAGLAIAPLAIGWPVASTIGGRLLPRLGYQPLVRLGFLLSAVACVALAMTLRAGASLDMPRITSGVMGLGLGFANTALLIAVQSSVAWEQRGVATASTMLFRTVGGALAVGGMGAVLSSALDRHGVSADQADQLLSPHHGGLEPAALQSMGTALQAGLGTIFWMIAALACCALVVSLTFPRISLAESEAHAGPRGTA